MEQLSNVMMFVRKNISPLKDIDAETPLYDDSIAAVSHRPVLIDIASNQKPTQSSLEPVMLHRETVIVERGHANLWEACLSKAGHHDTARRMRIFVHQINLHGSRVDEMCVKLSGLQHQTKIVHHIAKREKKYREADITLFYSGLPLEFASVFGHLDALTIDADMVSKLVDGGTLYRLHHQDSRGADYVVNRREDYAREFGIHIEYDSQHMCFVIAEKDWQTLRDTLLHHIVYRLVSADSENFQIDITNSAMRTIEKTVQLEIIYTLVVI